MDPVPGANRVDRSSPSGNRTAHPRLAGPWPIRVPARDRLLDSADPVHGRGGADDRSRGAAADHRDQPAGAVNCFLRGVNTRVGRVVNPGGCCGVAADAFAGNAGSNRITPNHIGAGHAREGPYTGPGHGNTRQNTPPPRVWGETPNVLVNDCGFCGGFLVQNFLLIVNRQFFIKKGISYEEIYSFHFSNRSFI